MKASRFENDLKNLATDIASTLNMKKQAEDFTDSLVDCMLGLKTFHKRVENLISTGELLEQFLFFIEDDLPVIFQKDNFDAHEHILEQIIVVFTQYGTKEYKENIVQQVLTLDCSIWHTGNFNIPSEYLLTLFLKSYIQFYQSQKNPNKKLLAGFVDKMFAANQLLLDLQSVFEDF